MPQLLLKRITKKIFNYYNLLLPMSSDLPISSRLEFSISALSLHRTVIANFPKVAAAELTNGSK